MTLPTEPDVQRLVDLIMAAARGEQETSVFIKTFQRTYESLESQGRIHYASKEQARLIWDVLWDLEYYSTDPSAQEDPAEWHTLAEIEKTIQRVAAKLAEL